MARQWMPLAALIYFTLAHGVSARRDHHEGATLSMETDAAPAPGPDMKLPEDIPTIAARFKVMQKEIQTLTERVTQVQLGVVEVEGIANSSALSLAATEKELNATRQKAASNEALSLKLKAESIEAKKEVAEAGKELKALKKVVMALQQDVAMLGSNAPDIAKRIVQLETDMKEMLPKEDGGIMERIEDAEKTMKKYQEELKDGKMDKIIKKSLRANFKRATEHIENLADEVARSKAGASENDDEADSDDGDDSDQ
eukprot:gnl/TRDRNA2_/TRDRNA2_183000_c0_seq1.p1 gnl/TRDRNA2_/TRDRNA2_183000_c0~~gnl/TRDRNA2_/TRDRNA2_183000_c0_seq1.p1  ORF type:complete len:256 (+),score=92.50 gnl/TRDRNA2_/TRDRNA2_183000_c0_seq1:104-871(+)